MCSVPITVSLLSEGPFPLLHGLSFYLTPKTHFLSLYRGVLLNFCSESVSNSVCVCVCVCVQAPADLPSLLPLSLELVQFCHFFVTLSLWVYLCVCVNICWSLTSFPLGLGLRWFPVFRSLSFTLCPTIY